MQMQANEVAAVFAGIGVGITIITALISCTWYLSGKITSLGSDVSIVRSDLKLIQENHIPHLEARLLTIERALILNK